MSKDKFFVLYGNCFITRGASRSIVIDTINKKYYSISNELALYIETGQFLKKEKGISDDKLSFFHLQIDILLKKEVGFLCSSSDIKNFPQIEPKGEMPSKVTNCIIDYNGMFEPNYASILIQLHNLGCQYVQLRFYVNPAHEKLIEIIDCINESNIKYFEFILQHQESIDVTINYIKDTIKAVSKIRIYGSPVDYQEATSKGYYIQINKSSTFFDSENCCGRIVKDEFSISKEFYIESKNYNSCLYKKISIDKNGFIRNCPSITFDLGHVNNTSLEGALNHKLYSKFDHFKKDSIEICKDCEFRYICTDCRAYTQNNEETSKPSHCRYNPYKAVWE